MYYVGLDIHQRSTSVEILDCNGKLVKRGEWKLPWDPCQDASADKNRLGHITRDGPPTVRKLMVEAAWQGVRRSPTIKAFYDRVTRNDPDRKKIAIVATAHYMTRVAVSMLKNGETWREDPRATKGNGENQGSGQAL